MWEAGKVNILINTFDVCNTTKKHLFLLEKSFLKFYEISHKSMIIKKMRIEVNEAH